VYNFVLNVFLNGGYQARNYVFLKKKISKKKKNFRRAKVLGEQKLPSCIRSCQDATVNVVYLLFDGMFDSDDAAHDPGCHGNVVAVAAVAAEPQQHDDNSEEQQTRQRYDRDHPRVVHVYTARQGHVNVKRRMSDVHCVPKKHLRHFQLYLENQ